VQNKSPTWIKLSRECHGLAAQLDMDHSLLSVFACPVFAVASWSELRIIELIFIRDILRQNLTGEKGLTEKQQGEIYRLGYKVLRRDAPWIRNFIYHQTGQRKSVQDLDSTEASKVISGMRAIAG